MIDKSTGKAGPRIGQGMQHWFKDDDFAGIRSDKNRPGDEELCRFRVEAAALLSIEDRHKKNREVAAEKK
jgi:hypothetical protein